MPQTATIFDDITEDEWETPRNTIFDDIKPEEWGGSSDIQPLKALKEGTKDVGRSTLQFSLGAEQARDIPSEAQWFGRGNLQSLMTPQARQDVIDMMDPDATGWEKQARVEAGLRRGQKKQVKNIKETIDSKWLKPDKTLIRPDGFKGYVQDVLRMAPQIASQAGTSLVAGPAGGVAMMASQIGGSHYDSLIKEGVEPERAFKAAVADAVLQAPLEQIGMSKALSLWKPGKTASKIIKGAGEAGFVGWFTEMLQKYPELAADIWAKGEKLSGSEKIDKFVEGSWQAFKEGSYEGLVAAPFEALIGVGAGLSSSGVDVETDQQESLRQAIASGEISAEEAAEIKAAYPEMSDIIDQALSEVAPQAAEPLPKESLDPIELARRHNQQMMDSINVDALNELESNKQARAQIAQEAAQRKEADTEIVHTMPDGSIMEGPEHEGAIPGSERPAEQLAETVPPEAVQIPEFKNTNEAVAFGEKATPEQIKEIERLRQETQNREAELKAARDFSDERTNNAYRGQLYREALEASRGEHRKSERRKEPMDMGGAKRVEQAPPVVNGEQQSDRRIIGERRKQISQGDTVRHKRKKYTVEEVENEKALISNDRGEKIVLISELSQWESKPQVQQKPEGARQAIGTAWMGDGWKPITDAVQIRRGKNKGKYRVTLHSGRKKLVDTNAVRLGEMAAQDGKKLSTTPGQGITPKQAEQHFKDKGFKTKRTGDLVSVKTQSGHLYINVTDAVVTDDATAIKVGYSRNPNPGEKVAGSYKNLAEYSVIKLKRSIADAQTLDHELYHHIKASGVLTRAESRAIERAAGKDEEAQARWIESRLRDRAQAKPAIIKRAIQKIADILDAFINIFHATQRGIVRKAESGEFLRRKGQPQGKETAFSKTAGRWHSQMEKHLSDKLPGSGSPKQIKQMVKSWANKGQIKAEELEWSGLEDWFDQQEDKVSKQQVLDYLAENNVRVEEVEKGGGFSGQKLSREDLDEIKNYHNWGTIDQDPSGDVQWNLDENADDSDTGWQFATTEQITEALSRGSGVKFQDYQLPGGENYRELLLTMPQAQGKANRWEVQSKMGSKYFERKEDAESTAQGIRDAFPDQEVKVVPAFSESEKYTSSHWSEPNVLAHVRFNERTDADGNRLLFIEEVQSDWMQQGRKEGFKKSYEKWKQDYLQENDWADAIPEKALKKRFDQYQSNSKSVPNAPFKKTWPLLTIKRMVRYAAENGYDAIAWTPGEVQAERYDLSKQVDVVSIARTGENLYDIDVVKDDTVLGDIQPRGIPLAKVEEMVGKDLAEKAANQKVGEAAEYEGDDLKVGGEGMKGFYDKILPSAVNKFFNKAAWGKAKVGTSDIRTTEVWSLPITEKMRSKALYEGMPLFSTRRDTTKADEILARINKKNEGKRQRIDAFLKGLNKKAEQKPEKIAKETEKETDLSDYESVKDVWFGKKDVKELKHKVEKNKFQTEIKDALGIKRYNQKAKNIDRAIQIYIDLKRNPEHLKEYYDKLTPAQKNIVDLSQNLPEGAKKVADQISESYKKTGLEAMDAGVIRNVLDNYAARKWDIPKRSIERLRRFGTTTGHAKARKFDTILEGWASGYNLKVEGATNNLQILKDEIMRTIQDKKFLKTMMGLKDIDGKPLATPQYLDGYTEIKHPNFVTWKPAGKAKEGATGEIKWYGRNSFADENGNVWERQRIYAQEKIAKNLNNILGTSALNNLPGIHFVTKYNAIMKSWILQSSLFHHLAFMRSYYLGTNHKTWKELNIRKAYKEGYESIQRLEPTVRHAVKNGLTLGVQQEWNESLLREKTKIGRILDKTGATKAVKDKILMLREMQADFLFGKFGAGLKVKAFEIEYRNELKKHPNGNPDAIAKRVARLINDDFGGLHLGRMGRNPTLQHVFRIFALAPDWTESNIRTMVKSVKADSAAETAMYRKFWSGILIKGIAATALMNLALAGGDPREWWKKYRRAWKEGHFRWLDIDITPIYRALGGKSKEHKYFSLLGHFKDPAKFITHPIRSAHHKGSVVYRTMHEALTGVNWAGQKFTTLRELVDDGELTKYGAASPIGYSQFPSYIISQIVGSQPVQIQNAIRMMTGEMDKFDGIANSMGLSVTTTYSPKNRVDLSDMSSGNINELEKLGINFNLPHRKYKIRNEDIEIDEDVYKKYSEEFQRRLIDRFKKTMRSPSWRNMTDERKIERLKNIRTNIGRRYTERFKYEAHKKYRKNSRNQK